MTTFTGTRRIAYAAATTAVIAALVSAGTTAASAAGDDFTLQPQGFLTLPAGDAFNDTMTLDIAASSEATVDVTVTDTNSGLQSTIATDVALTARTTGFGFDIPVPVTGLTAGIHELRVANSADETSFSTTQIVVGSGKAIAASVALSETKVFPYKDGFRDASRVTVVAIDETGTKLPFTGSAVVKVGAKSARVALSKSGTALLPVRSVGNGTGSVSASITDPTGATFSPNSKKLVVSATAVTKVGLSVPKTIYPKKDKYLDSAKISIAATSSTGKPLRTAGAVTISFKGKTVKTWKVSSTSSKALNWNGLANKKLKPGKYTVTYSTVGPEGKRIARSASITVSDKKLVAKTTSVWKNADKVFSDYYPLDEMQQGVCGTLKGSVRCVGYDLYSDSDYSLLLYGQTSVPSTVRTNAKYRAPQVRISLEVQSLTGRGAWAYGSEKSSKDANLRKGTKNIGWLTLSSKQKSVGLTVGLDEYSSLVTNRVRVEYRYYQLK